MAPLVKIIRRKKHGRVTRQKQVYLAIDLGAESGRVMAGVWHGKTIRKQFEQQAIEKLNPQSYDLTRNRGRIQLNVRCPMSERIEGGIGPGATLTFTDLDNLPTAHEGVLKSPENPLD